MLPILNITSPEDKAVMCLYAEAGRHKLPQLRCKLACALLQVCGCGRSNNLQKLHSNASIFHTLTSKFIRTACHNIALCNQDTRCSEDFARNIEHVQRAK